MAIVTFGATARATDSIAIKNTTTSSVVFGILRSTVVEAGKTKFLTLADYDARLRGTNIHHNNLYAVNSDGKTPYLDDVAEFAKLLRNGTLVLSTASTVASGGFTTGAPLASSVYGDGSVVFS